MILHKNAAGFTNIKFDERPSVKINLGHWKMLSPSFSWATGEPHETSGVVPKALQSLQAGISVFLVGKAAFQSIPSIR
jgi:hypothetical protein